MRAGAGLARGEGPHDAPAVPAHLNALVGACNQTSNREPVVSYDETTVQGALDELKDQRLVRFVLPSHGRSVVRYRQVLDETLGLDAAAVRHLGRAPAAWAADGRRAAHPDRADGPVRRAPRDRARAGPPGLARRAPGRQRRPAAGPEGGALGQLAPESSPADAAPDTGSPTPGDEPARTPAPHADGAASPPADRQRRTRSLGDRARRCCEAELAGLRADVAQLRQELEDLRTSLGG